MKILLAHNFYQQPGGEDEVFRTERDLLRSFGHDPVEFVVHNQVIDDMGRLEIARDTVWNRGIARDLRESIAKNRVDIVHFHNTFPLISPGAYSAVHAQGAVVVQTLHNFRLICSNAVLFRDGAPCEKCLGRTFPWPSVVHSCYHHGRAATTVVAATLAFHNIRGTWTRDVDLYTVPSESARKKFVEHGLPADRIAVKPNFLYPEPGIGPGGGGYAIFVGRLSSEKGVDTLLKAWETQRIDMPLKIVGDGPIAEQVKQAAARCPSIQWLGRRDLNEVYDLIGAATMLIFPSNCYETFGRVIIEALARGTPVIASNHGAPADLVKHEQTGLLFTPGNPAALAAQVNRLAGDPSLLTSMRASARTEFETQYTSQRAYDQLLEIYRRALAGRPSASSSPRVSEAMP